LRTILFEERGIDVYFQGDHFHSLNSTSREVSFKQVHAWQGSSLVPLFEFLDKRHFMEFYLNFKVPYPKGFFVMMETIKPRSPMLSRRTRRVRGVSRRSRKSTPWSEMP